MKKKHKFYILSLIVFLLISTFIIIKNNNSDASLTYSDIESILKTGENHREVALALDQLSYIQLSTNEKSNIIPLVTTTINKFNNNSEIKLFSLKALTSFECQSEEVSSLFYESLTSNSPKVQLQALKAIQSSICNQDIDLPLLFPLIINPDPYIQSKVIEIIIQESERRPISDSEIDLLKGYLSQIDTPINEQINSALSKLVYELQLL